ncbi:MAG TPA: hypothetical protein VME92_04810 [Acetobacteraceae bacterium]|nr:hypothetical protein [Acetobacteraceae bacterium]
MTARVLAVLAAVLLIGAFAIASLASPDMPLGEAVFMIDQNLLGAAEHGIQANFWPWVWNGVAVPLLLRPAWLIPASLGLICAGAAATLTSRHVPRTRRRS